MLARHGSSVDLPQPLGPPNRKELAPGHVEAQVGDGVHDTSVGDELARDRAEREDALHVSAGRPA